MNCKGIALLLCSLAWMVAAQATTLRAQGRSSVASIEQVRGNLFLARYGASATVFLITREGAIVADPIGSEAATWLTQEIARRFPGTAVRYVLHTHFHFDRASGADAFGTQTVTIGHRAFNRLLSDVKGIGNYADVRPVGRTFNDRTRVELGGQVAELIEVGGGHSADMSVVYFPHERTVFAADPPAVDVAPFSFGSFSAMEVRRWLQAMAALEVDTIVTGDGRRLDVPAVLELGSYVDALTKAVESGVKAGHSASRIHSDVSMKSHAKSPHIRGLSNQIEQVRRSMRLRSWAVQSSGGTSLTERNPSYCLGYTHCESQGGTAANGSIGLRYTRGALALAAEVDLSGQTYSNRSRPHYDESLAALQSQASVLLISPLLARGPIELTVLGGGTRMESDFAGIDRISETLVPVGGRHPISFRASGYGVTAGTDLSFHVASRYSVVVPARISRVWWDHAILTAGPMQARVGVGLRVAFSRRVVYPPGARGAVITKDGTTPGAQR